MALKRKSKHRLNEVPKNLSNCEKKVPFWHGHMNQIILYGGKWHKWYFILEEFQATSISCPI